MLKFAYILSIKGLHPDTYTKVLNETSNYSQIFGVDNMDETMELLDKIKEEGFTLINLCSAYDDEATARIAEASGIRTKNVHYLPAEAEKLAKAESLAKYGFIAIDPELEETAKVDIIDPAFTTYGRFIKDLDGACQAARELKDLGVNFIEMCNWFDGEKTQAVIDAIDCDIPVGSCGEC